MKPLIIFETKQKGKASSELLLERVHEYVFPEFKKAGIKIELHKIVELEGSLVLSILNNKKEVILAFPWVRERGIGNITKTLADYPRLNIVKSYKKLKKEEDKIKKMRDLLQIYNMYFLVVLYRPGIPNMYWFGKYTDIPIELWKTTYREKTKPTDRIHFPDYKEYNFVKIEELKKQINKI
jgi:hypothetical protein